MGSQSCESATAVQAALDCLDNCLKNNEEVAYAIEQVGKHFKVYYSTENRVKYGPNFYQIYLDMLSKYGLLSDYLGNTITIFEEGCFLLALETILHELSTNTDTCSCLELLENLIFREPLFKYFCSISLLFDEVKLLEVEAGFRIVLSITDRFNHMADFCKRAAFSPEMFGSNLAIQVFKVVSFFKSTDTKYNVKVISLFVALFCLRQQPKMLLGPLYALSVQHDKTIFRDLFFTLPDRQIESVLYNVLTICPNSQACIDFVGNLIQKPKVEYVLGKKFLLTCQNDLRLLKVAIGYLALCCDEIGSKGDSIMLNSLKHLFKAWGDATLVNDRPVILHLNITRSIVLLISILKPRLSEPETSKIFHCLISGVTTHLEINDGPVRDLGMLTAKLCLDHLQLNGPQLEYDVSKMKRKDEFNSLLQKGVYYLNDSPDEKVITTPTLYTTNPRDMEKRIESLKISEELDSDDELVPFNMSEDVPKSEAEKPKYIGDLIEVLTNPEGDGEKVQVALKSAVGLLKSQLFSNKSLTIECLDLFLNLSNDFSLDIFEETRFNCLITCVEQCPAECVGVLAKKFFEPGAYSIRQRLDILQVIAQSAQNMAFPNELYRKQFTPSNHKSLANPKVTYYFPLSSSVNRNYISNKYCAVAPSYFYPLYVGSQISSLQEGDPLLLEKWLLTLGIICYCNVNSVNMGEMCRCLLSCCWSLKSHSNRSVRIAALWAVSMVFNTSPGHSWLDHMDETAAWFEFLKGKIQDMEGEEHKWCSSALIALTKLNFLPFQPQLHSSSNFGDEDKLTNIMM